MSALSMERRAFLKLAGVAAVATASTGAHGAAPPSVQIVVDPADAIAASAPVAWAVRQLRRTLTERGANVEMLSAVPHTKEGRHILIVLSGAAPGMAALTQPESLRIVPRRTESRSELSVSGADARGLVYAVLELADRVQCSADKSLGLSFAAPIEESPANMVRSTQRAFCSEVEDKPWYYDKSFWTGYLDMLAANRFNRFNLAFGFGYDFPKGVTDDYFHFPYPYLLDVPGYDVRVVPLAAGERERNLEMFRFIATETAARGLHFQLGIWTHAYAWTDSPNSTHHIEGLTPDNHARYCRDALAMLLKECPEIQGLTMRVHGESGIPEGNYPFWETLFEAVAKCGRTIELDMHAKGINQIMIDMAVKTGAQVKVSAKYSAEHMGLGYHQADIRELEIPRPERMETGVFSVSNGDRRFTRYGYADLFQQDRKFDVLFRLWPGTQRHLLWGDPATAAAYARSAHFCGASGLEICEPLTFKGREGSGLAGGRCGYADKTLAPKQDWEKFAYTYRLWGRLLYNPECDADVWRRSLRQQFAGNASAAETALANASRILPLITTAQMTSASNHSYWPEIYDNMPIVIGSEPSPYNDTPTPHCFGTVSPLDPQLFSSIKEFVDELLDGKPSPRYSPIAVAAWLEDMASAAETANGAIARSSSVELSRWQEDVRVQVGLGRFFAAKLRSGLAWEIYQRTGSTAAAQQAVAKYTEARDAWAAMAQRARAVYVTDITYGRTPERRGDWAKRLPGIDRDLAAMRAAANGTNSMTATVDKNQVDAAVTMIAARPQRTMPQAKHIAATLFRPGENLNLHLELASAASVTLTYRHVNQGERWQSVAMARVGDGFSGSIAGDYTRSLYPLQYYFVVSTDGGSQVLFPGFDGTLSNQPYYAVWRRQS
jgi:hypothetical protein